ncbi:AAA family ATPase [Streptomyces sp. NRRL S-646]|uniref:AAA family ATPase n=1 Tax=Streptomyces sp. NRRL S-646 TaxID=1463917 RepID=UPI001900CDD2|nr:AAA family ATPase [Streptomyces sp. NRRL S-646]
MSQEQTGAQQQGDRLTGAEWLDTPDRGDGRVYVMPSELDFAVKVALATGRPLLLRGMPGSGKSSLAPFIAGQLGWRYYEHVVTYRTQPRELLWSFDSVRRLGDAQVAARRGERPDDASYVQPGVLWWALAPRSARRRGRPEGAEVPDPCPDPFEKTNADRSPDHAVVLIDEIDKADPDVPNSLLVPLGSHRFVVAEIGEAIRTEQQAVAPDPSQENVHRARHLVVLTTNEERELPQALLRRCVVHVLPEHDKQMLVRIAKKHMAVWPGEVTTADEELAEAVADKLMKVREQADKQDVRRPSTAEFLDALLACRSLGIRPGDEEWQLLTQNVLIKPQQMTGDPA